MSEFKIVDSISQLHQLLGLAPPRHPLVSVITTSEVCLREELGQAKYLVNLYAVALKSGVTGALGYGRNTYDFQEGTMVFTGPGQVVSKQQLEKSSGPDEAWTLLFHPDLLRTSALGRTIDSYSFFSYELHEALHLSEPEKQTLRELSQKIAQEYSQPIDRYTQKVLVSTIELLLDYCARYVDRQFYLRTNHHQDVVTRFEQLLKACFSAAELAAKGVPTVQRCGQELGMSPNYLSDVLKKETGRSAQDHLHAFLIERAKTSLLNPALSVSQVAYALGFSYPQHFSKLFKSKTGLSPSEYRTLN